MKRSHDSITKSSSSPLGALEFASALNGDDARSVLQALVRFAKTVRRERRQALSTPQQQEEYSSSDDNSDGEHDELDDEVPTITNKKKKQEAWMEDTGDFHVPFVGTSVAKGDTGTRVEGQWPSGLLQAYLKVSPMAIELSSGDLVPPSGHVHRKLLSHKSKQGKKTSQAIYKAHLDALAELVTASVPISVLKRDYGVLNPTSKQQDSSSTARDSFVSVVLRDRLAGLMALLNEEASGGKMMDRGLVAGVLRIVTNLAATSLGAAREVTRAIDASLKDGILKSLLRSKSRKETVVNDETNVVMKRDDGVRVECLRLAAVLAEWQDAAIVSFITTKGSRERKINPGILYLAIRVGLHDDLFEGKSQNDDGEGDGYLKVVGRLLRALECLLPEATRASRRPLLSTRDLIDLFSGEALVHITQISTCAPPLMDSDSFLQVVTCAAGTATDSLASPLERAGEESRRILFCFVANPERSPFLSRMSHGNANDSFVSHCAQQLVRAMMLLLQRRPSLSLQRFLIHCLQTTPVLVPHFFKLVTIPDPKQTFNFIARMSFLFRLLREAPPVSSCVNIGAKPEVQDAERVIACVIPANLKKHVMSKVLQSPNALVVSEMLKLLCALVERFQVFNAHIKTNTDEQVWHLLEDAFGRRLPDMQPLLSIRSRFDPFSSRDGAKASTVVVGYVCKVLDSYSLHVPIVLKSVKFDWTKLLPPDASTFCAANPFLQLQLLQTLEKVLALHEKQADSHRLTGAVVRVLLEVMVTSSRTTVHQKARSVALQIIRSPFFNFADTDVERKACIEYETSLLLDGLEKEIIDEFCALLIDRENARFEHGMAVAHAWNNTGFDVPLPSINFSPLLTAMVAVMDKASNSLVLFGCQILTKCLLFQRQPLPLASLIANKLADFESDVQAANLLCRYSRSLLASDDWDPEERLSTLASLLSCLFSPDCLQNVLMKSLVDGTNFDLSRARHFTDSDVEAAVRQCLHVSMVDSSTSVPDTQRVSKLRTLIPLLGLSKGPAASTSLLGTIFNHPLVTDVQYPWTELASFQTVVLSLPGASSTMPTFLATAPTKTINVNELLQENDTYVFAIEDLVLFSLLSPHLPNQVASRVLREILIHLRSTAKEENRDLFSALDTLARYWIERAPVTAASIPLDALLEAWHAAVKSIETNETACHLACSLEALLSQTLETECSKNASDLYSLLLKRPPIKIVRVCIHFRWLLSENENSATLCRPSLLSTLIDVDPMKFGKSFLKQLIRIMGDTRAHMLLQNGCFDDELGAVSRCTELLESEEFGSLKDAVVKRSLEVLSIAKETRHKSSSRRLEDGLATLLCKECMLQGRNLDLFVEYACKFRRRNFTQRCTDKSWLQVSVTLLCREEGGVHELGMGPLLSSITLGCAFWTLQSSLKSHFKTGGAKSLIVSTEAVDRILDMIVTRRIRYDASVLTRDVVPAVTGTIKTALKYGLAHTSDEERIISERCFRLVRTLLVETYDPSSLLHALKSECILLNPSTILALILSHSHFHEAMVASVAEGECSSGENTILELVRLLLVCTSMSRETVTFRSDLLDTLLSAYNAGTTLVDITLRRLVGVYAIALHDRGKESDLPYLETLTWKGVANVSGASSTTSGWDWLANGIEIARIRATLSQFPVHDRMKADPVLDVEVWLDGGDNGEQTRQKGASDNENDDMSTTSGPTSDSSDVSMESVSNDESAAVEDGHRQTIDFDTWTGPGADVRYSPAFVLPLILAALESSRSDTDLGMSAQAEDMRLKYERHDEQGDEQQESPSVKEFVLLAQRLCEKGCLSLALGSLCSECPSLRKVAVVILGHFKKALDTKEARKLTTWRERPQLAMLVDSVQRGLAVRVAVRRDPHEVSSPLHVPKLPALSAVFLARAALVVVKPDDPMFGPMNRYFLRLENGYGAFQDTNRIPAFISLFCSSADEPGQARRERMWALQLLKDSFVEPYCYRLIESCHAPELILTSFGNSCTSQENSQHESERVRLLDTLTSLLEKGGRQATFHLIGRLGLLSWLRGQLATNDLLYLLPSIESRCSFLRLMSAALVMARLYLGTESSDRSQLVMESKLLITHVVALYDDSFTQGLVPASDHKDASPPNSFGALTSQVLGALVNLLKDIGSNGEWADVQPFGISLQAASTLLQTMPQDLLETVVSSLCVAPFRIDKDFSQSGALFSKLVLSSLAANTMDADIINSALVRVKRLILMDEPLASLGEILDALLACRCQCLLSCSEDAWFECLEAIVDPKYTVHVPSPDELETFRVGKALFSALIYGSD